MTIYAPMPEPGDVRASGGIVHSDGNIFFTNIEKMESLFRAYADATCALREQDSWPDEASLPDGPLCCNKTKSVRCPGCPHAEPQDDRAAFEAWAQAEYGGPYTTLRRDDQPGSHHLGEYTRSYIETSWRAWQAAIASRPVPPPISGIFLPLDLAIRLWGFLAQDCTPCMSAECQIAGAKDPSEFADELNTLISKQSNAQLGGV